MEVFWRGLRQLVGKGEKLVREVGIASLMISPTLFFRAANRGHGVGENHGTPAGRAAVRAATRQETQSIAGTIPAPSTLVFQQYPKHTFLPFFHR